MTEYVKSQYYDGRYAEVDPHKVSFYLEDWVGDDGCEEILMSFFTGHKKSLIHLLKGYTDPEDCTPSHKIEDELPVIIEVLERM